MPYLSKLTVVTPPSAYPVDVNLVRKHTRIDSSYDDDLLNIYIGSATATIESFLNRALLTQTLSYAMTKTADANSNTFSYTAVNSPVSPYFPPLGYEWLFGNMQGHDIELPRSPVQSVTSVVTGQWGATDSTLILDSDYNLDLTLDPARVHLLTSGLGNSTNWQFIDHTIVTYFAGYGADATFIPNQILHALLLLVAHHYENRGDTGEGIPESVYNLLWRDRLVGFGET